MITEDYVSFETAKILKEKGFNEPTIAYTYGEGMINYYSSPKITDERSVEAGRYPLPTLQMAMKWLREVHKLVICAEIGNENYTGNTDYSNPDIWYWFFDITNERGVVIDTESDFVLNEYTTYEEACEAGIKYCLEHLI